MPWTTLSYLIYGDLTYYWLILLANTNKKLNPMYASVSDKIFIVKPEYLSMVVEAIENEKDVTVLIELRACFDEKNNIYNAELLEEAGCQIIYGFENSI